MPRFAILIHNHRFLHWDFLLEEDAGCRTWRLLNDPESASDGIKAESLPVHRLMYLDYEGPVSRGRGTVVQWDRGTFAWRVNEPTVCEVMLTGKRWQGLFRLEKTQDQTWTVRAMKD